MFDNANDASAKLKQLEELARSLGYNRTAASLASLAKVGSRRQMAAHEADDVEGQRTSLEQ